MRHVQPRGNPAHDVERYAIDVVTRWVGKAGVVEDRSAGHGPDFAIEYADGRSALGEVGWYEDPGHQEMWGQVFKRLNHQVVELPSGLGQWGVGLKIGASIKRLYAELPRLLADVTAAGESSLEIYGKWPRGAVADRARTLGVQYARRIDAAADRAIFFISSSGGIVPLNVDVVAKWVSAVLSDPDYLDMTGKLLPLEADEKHVFIMSGSRTDFGTDERLRRLSDQLPTAVPDVPVGITHVWVAPSFGPGDLGLWTTTGGWQVVPGPS